MAPRKRNYRRLAMAPGLRAGLALGAMTPGRADSNGVNKTAKKKTS